MQIWDKGVTVSTSIIDFTVGNDYLLDMNLIAYDCIASKAHALMLSKIDVITSKELEILIEGLDEIIRSVKAGQFEIKKEDEDCHAAIEKYLTEKHGEVGKKIHTGRSRNDQVLTALRLFEKDYIDKLEGEILTLELTLKELVEKNQNIPMPGYTHMRKAMPTSISTWLGSFVDALRDDRLNFKHVRTLIDQSPLGSAAGFGVPVFDIDREFTSKELGFNKVMENPMYSQITRGKFEGNILNSCSQVMLTLNKLATDLITYSMTEFSFVKLPKDQCTGSSIMPQKVNPDVLELVRAKYHDVIGEELKVKSTIGNLISGYNRDVQISKNSIMSGLFITSDCLSIMNGFIKELTVDKAACDKAITEELFATEEVNKLVKAGESFRSAYQKVGKKF